LVAFFFAFVDFWALAGLSEAWARFRVGRPTIRVAARNPANRVRICIDLAPLMLPEMTAI
jgi:hypothetical protein